MTIRIFCFHLALTRRCVDRRHAGAAFSDHCLPIVLELALTALPTLPMGRGAGSAIVLGLPRGDGQVDVFCHDTVEAIALTAGGRRPDDHDCFDCAPIRQRKVIQLNSCEPSRAFLLSGQRIVEECDLIVAIWDRRPPKGRGGMADVVEYAESLQRRLIFLNPIPMIRTER